MNDRRISKTMWSHLMVTTWIGQWRTHWRHTVKSRYCGLEAGSDAFCCSALRVVVARSKALLLQWEHWKHSLVEKVQMLKKGHERVLVVHCFFPSFPWWNHQLLLLFIFFPQKSATPFEQSSCTSKCPRLEAFKTGKEGPYSAKVGSVLLHFNTNIYLKFYQMCFNLWI